MASPDPRLASRPSPVPWVLIGLGVAVMIFAWVVATLTGTWGVVRALCIECKRAGPNLAPGLSLSLGALLGGSGGAAAAWLGWRAKRDGRPVHDLVVPFGVVVVLGAVMTGGLGVLALVYVLR